MRFGRGLLPTAIAPKRARTPYGRSAFRPTLQSCPMTTHPTQQYQARTSTAGSRTAARQAQAYKAAYTTSRSARPASPRTCRVAAPSYFVAIDFHRDLAGGFRVEMSCTCPVGRNCKHAAAVLLVALARREQGPR